MSDKEKEELKKEVPGEEAVQQEAPQPEGQEPASSEKKEEKPAPTLEEQLAEMKGNYLRALAEQENYRKRMAREMNDLKESTRQRTLGEVVGIYDLLQMAVDAARSAQDVASLRQGIEMTFGELKRTFSSFGVTAVDATGQVFDPALHQAVGTEPSDEIPEGTVIRQWKPGFKVGEKLLRPAVVVVSSGPAKAPEAEAAPAEEK